MTLVCAQRMTSMISGCIRVVSSNATGQVLFCFHEHWIRDWSFPQKKKKTLALKWATSNYTMLGIKADSVPFPLRKNEIGKKQLIVVRLSTLSIRPVKWRRRSDLKAYVFLKIYHWHCKYVRKPEYHFKWKNEILILLGSQIVAISSLFYSELMYVTRPIKALWEATWPHRKR